MASLDEELLDASERGEREEVERQLRAGASLEARDASQCTPLFLASLWGHEPVVSLLLDEGAAVDARDDEEDTPLHAGAWRVVSTWSLSC